MPLAFQALGHSAASRGPPCAVCAHDDYRMRFEDGVDYFFGVADQMDINAGFDGSVLGKRAEMTPGVWERHIGLMKRQRVRDDFQHQGTDSSETVVWSTTTSMEACRVTIGRADVAIPESIGKP